MDFLEQLENRSSKNKQLTGLMEDIGKKLKQADEIPMDMWRSKLDELSRVSAQAARLQSQLAAVTEERDGAKSGLEAERGKAGQLRAEVDEASSRAASASGALDFERQRADMAVGRLTEQLTNAEARSAAAESMGRKAASEREAAMRDLLGLKQAHEQAGGELVALRAEKEQIASHLWNLSDKLKALDTEAQRERRRADDAEVAAAGLTAELGRVRGVGEGAVRKADGLATELSQLRAKTSEAEGLVRDMAEKAKTRFDALEAQAQTRIDALEASLEEGRNSRAELEGRAEAFRSKMEEATDTATKLGTELTEAAARAQEAEELRAALAVASREASKLQEAAAKERARGGGLEEKLEASEAAVATLEAAAAGHSEHRANADDAVSCLEEEAVALRGKLKESEANAGRLEDALFTCEAEKEEARDDVTRFREGHADAEARVEQLGEAVRGHEQRGSAKRAAQDRAEMAVEDLRGQLRRSLAHCARMAKATVQASEAEEAARARTDTHAADVQALRDRSARLEGELEASRGRAAQLEDEKADLMRSGEGACLEADEAHGNAKRLQDELEAEMQRRRVAETAVATARGEHERALIGVQRELAEATGALGASVAAAEQEHENVARLNEALKGAKKGAASKVCFGLKGTN